MTLIADTAVLIYFVERAFYIFSKNSWQPNIKNSLNSSTETFLLSKSDY